MKSSTLTYFSKFAEYIYVALWGALLFIPFIGSVHLFDWDEINFAESAREMLLTGDYFRVQINYTAFWEKPPFFFWLQVAAMKCFGINEFAARFPNAICGIATLLILFHIGKKEQDRTTAIAWVLLMCGSFTPHLYFKSGIIDPWFNLFIFLSLYHIIKAAQLHISHITPYVWAGFFAGLAFLTKGPVSFLIIALCVVVFWIVQRFVLFFNWKQVAAAVITAILVSIVWIAPEVSANGWSVIGEFITYQIDLFKNPVAGHGQPFYYHAVVLLLGCFPASLFFIPALRLRHLEYPKRYFAVWMSVLFWVVLVLFSSVTTKIVHYSSLCYIPLTFIAGTYIAALFKKQQKLPVWLTWTIGCMGLILGIALTVLTQIETLKPYLIPRIKDPFAVASLNIPSPWYGYEFIAGFMFVLIAIFFVLVAAQKRYQTAILLLLIGISIQLPIYMRMVVSKIEAYSQRPAIEFFKELSDKDVYVETLGHKSYAQYFYSHSKPRPVANPDWLRSGEADKPVYFVSKITYWQHHPDSTLEPVESKGGFVLLKLKSDR